MARMGQEQQLHAELLALVHMESQAISAIMQGQIVTMQPYLGTGCSAQSTLEHHVATAERCLCRYWRDRAGRCHNR